MTVRCEGDSREMEQLGEKQDFEAELSRLGFMHEAFILYVRRTNPTSSDIKWASNYTVCVTNTCTKRQNIYWAGHGKHWVSEFSADASSGLYGAPEMSRAAGLPARGWERPTLVVRGEKL